MVYYLWLRLIRHRADFIWSPAIGAVRSLGSPAKTINFS